MVVRPTNYGTNSNHSHPEKTVEDKQKVQNMDEWKIY